MTRLVCVSNRISLPRRGAAPGGLAVGVLAALQHTGGLWFGWSGETTEEPSADPEVLVRGNIRFATIDSSVALMFALFINAAILVMAAAVFHGSGHEGVADIGDAYQLLSPLLGTKMASILFAVALLCSGQNATLTGTLAGQIVMEGFINLRLRPWLRRLITRLIAIVPAVIVVALYGERGTGQLIILSQVVLSLQLPFAVVPLVMFTASRTKMGPFVAPRWLSLLAALTAAAIIALNVKLVWNYVSG